MDTSLVGPKRPGRRRGRNISFTVAQRRAALEACADGLSDIECAQAADISKRSLEEWLQRGTGTYPGARIISPERHAQAVRFAEDWAKAKEIAEARRLARAKEWKEKRKAEIESKLEMCLDTALNHGATGYEKKVVATTEKVKGNKTVTTTVESAIPSWQAAIRTLEILAPERHGRIGREEAIALRRRDEAGEKVVSKEEAKAGIRRLLGLLSPDDLREVLQGLPLADEPEDAEDTDEA